MERNLWLLVIARFFGEFASYIFDVGVLIYLYSETESMAVVSGFFLTQILPALFTMFFGKYIDQYRKNRIVCLLNISKVICMSLFLLNKQFYTILIINFVLSWIGTVENNTINAMMTDVFSSNKLIQVGSILSFLSSFSMIVAPMVAAYLAKYFSININIWFCIVCFGITALAYSLVNIQLQVINSGEEKICQKFINLNKKIKWIISFWSIFMFCIGIAAPLEIKMIEDVLGMDGSYYGVGNTVEGIGMLLASGVILKIVKKIDEKYIVGIGLFTAGLSYLFIAFSFHISVYYIGAILVGITAVLCPLGFRSSIQLYGEKANMGQIFSTSRFVVLIARALGTFCVGQLVLKCNIRIIYIIIGIILISVAFVYQRIKEKFI